MDGRGFAYDNEGPRHQGAGSCFTACFTAGNKRRVCAFIEARLMAVRILVIARWMTVKNPPQADGRHRFTG